jgi:predicted RNA-binding Zn-ribbon protein involved in translation (DUF1610 family)
MAVVSVPMLVARCPRCGAVDVAGYKVTVVLPGGSDHDGAWGFACPGCGVPVWHTACGDTREFLAGKGAVEVPWTQAPRSLRAPITGRDLDGGA